MTKRKKKSNALPGVEIMFILVLFGSFLVWAVSKCNMTKEMLGNEDTPTEVVTVEQIPPATPDNTNAAPASPAATIAQQPITNNPAVPNSTIPVAQTPPPTQVIPQAAPQTVYTRLYVTMDSLKMRTGPSLDSTIVARLPLFEEVIYLNEVTAFSQKINLGPEIADEPWVKVRNRTGQIGWIYGAGVHYYKKRRYPVSMGN